MTTFDDLLDVTKNEIPILQVSKLDKLSFQEYEDMVVDFYETIFDNYWTNKDIKVKFKISKSEVEFTFAQALLQLIFWLGNKKYNLPITYECFVDTRSLESKKLKKNCEYLALLLIKNMRSSEKKTEFMSYLFTTVLEWAYKIGKNSCYPQAFTLSLQDISNLANRNPEFNRLLHVHLDENMSVEDTERNIVQAQKDIERIISEDKHNELYPYIKSNKLNKMQLAQILYQAGYRSNIDKKLLPKPTNTSFLNGYQTASHYINECMVGRDAELTKKNIVRKSGDFSRKTDLLTINLHIDYNVEDCGTLHTVFYDVKTPFHLRMILSKYIVLENGKLHEVTEEDTDLIGKRVRLRSHICCALNNVRNNVNGDGKEYVCKTCYGARSEYIREAVIGGLPSIEAINPLSNKAMSAKHQVTSKVISISNSTLSKFFKIEGDEVYLRPEVEYKESYILISKEYEEALNGEFDDEENVDLMDIYLVKKNPTNNETERFKLDEENNGLAIMFSEELVENKKKVFKIPPDSEYMYLMLSKVDTDVPIFNLLYGNEDVSYYLKQLIALIDGSKIKQYKSFGDVLNQFTEIMYMANINSGIMALETIVHKLVRDRNNIMFRPDFSKESVDFIFVRLTDAVVYSPSFIMGISFRDLFKQFASHTTFSKHGQSPYDPFFRTSKGRIETKDDNKKSIARKIK